MYHESQVRHWLAHGLADLSTNRTSSSELHLFNVVFCHYKSNKFYPKGIENNWKVLAEICARHRLVLDIHREYIHQAKVGHWSEAPSRRNRQNSQGLPRESLFQCKFNFSLKFCMILKVETIFQIFAGVDVLRGNSIHEQEARGEHEGSEGEGPARAEAPSLAQNKGFVLVGSGRPRQR